MQSVGIINEDQTFYLHVFGLIVIYVFFVTVTAIVALKVGKGQFVPYPFAIRFFPLSSREQKNVLESLVICSNLFLFVMVIIFVFGGLE
jgi:hypothetical protein